MTLERYLCYLNLNTMPVFNVIRVNQTHVAKVLVARQFLPEPTVTDMVDIVGFKKWLNHIRKELKTSQQLSTITEHILN